MKRLTITLMALLALCGVGNAQISGLNVGYCDGEVSTTAMDGFATSEKDVWVEGAIYIPANKMNVYAGCHIDTIKAGLASKLKIDSLRVWVKRSLDGEELAGGGISKDTDTKLAKGWNHVALDEPYNIERSDEGLYIGYSFHQSGSSFGLSVLPTPQPNALFVKLGSGEWTDRSDEGTLCVEALVFGDELPRYNLELTDIDVQPTYIIDKGTLTLTASVHNIATATITSYDIECEVNGTTVTSTIDNPIAYGEHRDETLTLDLSQIITSVPTGGMMAITVNITNLKEGADENPDDNMMTTTFAVVGHDYTRMVLVEEFTTESCLNCPRVATYLENVMEQEEFASRVLSVEHHNGYYTDWLSIPADAEYLWFYNAGGSTYAPAVMFDRYSFGTSSPVMSIGSQDDMESAIRARMAEPAFVSAQLTAKLESDNTLKVTVTGERSRDDATVNPMRLTLMLVEDSIAARSQAGASGSFMHHNVGRAVNSTWGTELEWDGDEYSYEYTFNLRGDYVKEHLKVYAVLSDYDADDATACTVANAAQVTYKDFVVADGITTVNADDESLPTRYYTIDGIELKEPRTGLIIVKRGNTVEKRIYK